MKNEQIEKLYKENYSKICAFCYSVLRNKADAEDASSETFAKAYKAIHKSEVQKNSHLAWLYVIAKNVIKDKYRLSSSKNEVQMIYEDFEDDGDFVKDLENKDELASLESRFAKLTTEQREALILRYIDELEYTEISLIMNKSVNAVKLLVSKSLKKLRADESNIATKLAAVVPVFVMGNLNNILLFNNTIMMTGIGAWWAGLSGAVKAVIVTTSILAIGGVSAGSAVLVSSNLSSAPKDSVVTTPSVTVTTIMNTTTVPADWQSYTSKIGDIEIKFPADWYIYSATQKHMDCYPSEVKDIPACKNGSVSSEQIILSNHAKYNPKNETNTKELISIDIPRAQGPFTDSPNSVEKSLSKWLKFNNIDYDLVYQGDLNDQKSNIDFQIRDSSTKSAYLNAGQSSPFLNFSINGDVTGENFGVTEKIIQSIKTVSQSNPYLSGWISEQNNNFGITYKLPGTVYYVPFNSTYSEKYIIDGSDPAVTVINNEKHIGPCDRVSDGEIQTCPTGNSGNGSETFDYYPSFIHRSAPQSKIASYELFSLPYYEYYPCNYIYYPDGKSSPPLDPTKDVGIRYDSDITILGQKYRVAIHYIISNNQTCDITLFKSANEEDVRVPLQKSQWKYLEIRPILFLKDTATPNASEGLSSSARKILESITYISPLNQQMYDLLKGTFTWSLPNTGDSTLSCSDGTISSGKIIEMLNTDPKTISASYNYAKSQLESNGWKQCDSNTGASSSYLTYKKNNKLTKITLSGSASNLYTSIEYEIE